jgi:hypothetical protein
MSLNAPATRGGGTRDPVVEIRGGMADVSSCVVDALPRQPAYKGDELGYFQYGGSAIAVAR